MPVIPRSERRVAVNPTPLPQISGEGFAAPGRALQKLGGAISGFAAEAEAEREKLDDFNFRLGATELQNRTNMDLIESRDNIQGDGRTYLGERLTNFDQQFTEFQQKFPNKQQEAKLLGLKLRGDLGEKAYGVQRGHLQDYYYNQTDNVIGNNIVPKVGSSLESAQQAGRSADAIIGSVPGLSPAKREELKVSAAKRIYEAWKTNADPVTMREDYEKFVGRGTQQDQDKLVNAVIQTESGGRADVVSKAGAIGLMQVMPDTAREIAGEIDPDAVGLNDNELKAYLKDPEVSRKYGTFYLNKMLERYKGDKEAALIAYNGGPSRADAWLKADRDDKAIPIESANYYKKVLGKVGEAGKPVSMTDFARGKGIASVNSGGAEAGYEAAIRDGVQPQFNRARTLGLEGAPLTAVQTRSGAKFSVASPAATQIKGFLDELEAAGYRIKPETSGGYNDRNIRGTNRKSQHAHGGAIDINWDENQFDEKGTNTLPPDVGKIAAKYGLSWGGYFKGSKKDAMHFEVSELMDGGSTPLTRVADASGGTMTDASPMQSRALTVDDHLRSLLIEKKRDVVKTSDNALEGRRFTYKQTLRDDVESLRRTGEGVEGVDLREFSRVLEPSIVDKYIIDRRQARLEHDAMSDFSNLTGEQLDKRLEEIEPKTGEDDFALKAKVFDKAAIEARKLRQLREKDPAAAVEDLPQVKEAMAGVDRAKPETVQNLVQTRLAAQERIGIPEALREPITKIEAKIIAAPMQGRQGKDLIAAATKVVADVEVQYGPYARSVAVSAIESAIRDREASEVITGVVSKALRGQKPMASDVRAIEQAGETAMIGQTMAPVADPFEQMGMGQQPAGMPRQTNPMAYYGMAPAGTPPPAKAIKFLQENPALAAEFEAKYGQPAAPYLIGK